MAVSPLKMHQIFMLALAGLRVEGEVAQVLVVLQPPPFWPSWCFIWVTGGRPVPLPQLWAGEPLAPFRRSGEQGGGAFPRTQLRLKWPGRSLGTTEETPGRHFHFQM